MSFNRLLRHRCTILRLDTIQFDGVPTNDYVSVAENVPCFLNLDFRRFGKDPMWTPDNGDAQNRSGVCFMKKDSLVKPGDRIEMTRGPFGIFLVDGTVDVVWTPARAGHIEFYVSEINRVYTPGVE